MQHQDVFSEEFVDVVTLEAGLTPIT